MKSRSISKASSSDPSKQRSPARRNFLKSVGVGGLAVAATTVATPATSASASNYGCCNLAHYPPNTSYSYCASHAAYNWRCYSSTFVYCDCCETAGNKLSAGRCQHD